MLKYKEKRWDSKRVLNSDGIPWSPSATVSVLAVAIGLQEGSGSSSFTIAIVLACIVCSLLTLLVILYTYIDSRMATFLQLCMICLNLLGAYSSC